jgi:hypothetical protein
MARTDDEVVFVGFLHGQIGLDTTLTEQKRKIATGDGEGGE